MNPCHNEECTLPRWRDGIDESMCVGHQPADPPMFVIDPRTNEPIELEAEAVECWECGAKPPAGLALADTAMMAGELWCSECLRTSRVQVKVRLDVEGDNY